MQVSIPNSHVANARQYFLLFLRSIAGKMRLEGGPLRGKGEPQAEVECENFLSE